MAPHRHIYYQVPGTHDDLRLQYQSGTRYQYGFIPKHESCGTILGTRYFFYTIIMEYVSCVSLTDYIQLQYLAVDTWYTQLCKLRSTRLHPIFTEFSKLYDKKPFDTGRPGGSSG